MKGKTKEEEEEEGKHKRSIRNEKQKKHMKKEK